jgi:hypothetical protein
LEPKLAAVGEGWWSVARRDALDQPLVCKEGRLLDRTRECVILSEQGVQTIPSGPRVTHDIPSSGEVLQVTYLAGPARRQAHIQALEGHSL